MTMKMPKFNELPGRENNRPSAPVSAGPNIKVEMIDGRPSEVEIKIRKFYEAMCKSYPTFNVISTTSHAMPTGVCVYITYSI